MAPRDDRRLLALAALALLAAYAVPLLAPPPAVLPEAAAPDAPLLARLFPGVPPLWVGARLACALAGAALAAKAASAFPVTRTLAPSGPAAPPPAHGALVAACAVATLHVLVGPFVPSLARVGQHAYFLAAWVPALALAIAARARAPRAPRRARAAARGPEPALLAVLAVWLLSRLPDLLRPTRAADPVDTWLSFEWLERAAVDGRNLLTDGFLPGLTCVYMYLQGVPLLGPSRIPVSLGWVLGVNVALAAGTAWAIGALAARLFGRTAAPVAAAVFLFSPFVLLMTLAPAPYVLGPFYTAGLLVLALRAHDRASAAALAALGALAGVAATSHPPLAPISGLALAAGLLAGWRAGLPPLALATPLLSFTAMLAPALPDADTLQAMVRDFTRERGQWGGLEAVLLGQRTPFDVPRLWEAGRPGPLDGPLAVALAPLAVPRTALRLWGDALLDPAGGALVAVGIATALRFARRSPSAALLLALLAVGAAPAVASSYDRPSLTRAFVALVPVALLGAAGAAVLGAAAFPAARLRTVSAAACAAVALGGIALFDLVNPRILRASWLGIAARALDGATPAGGALLLTYPGPHDLSWLHVPRIARALGDAPMPVLAYDGPAALAGPDGSAPRAELLVWSPALEADHRVSQAVCLRWPDAALYTLWDRAGLSRALAARPAGPGFQPALAAERWTESRCPGPPR